MQAKTALEERRLIRQPLALSLLRHEGNVPGEPPAQLKELPHGPDHPISRNPVEPEKSIPVGAQRVVLGLAPDGHGCPGDRRRTVPWHLTDSGNGQK
jgi:hypothetical protein